MDDMTLDELLADLPDEHLAKRQVALLRAVAEAADNVRHWYFEEPTISNALTLMQRLANALQAAKDGGAM